jgi:UDP-N-acetyl-alpha-D-quinovosamine dehydrogenase
VILVTGATGFVGQVVVEKLITAGHDVRACSRRHAINFHSSVDVIQSGDLSGDTDWNRVLQDVNIVIHLAARVHMMADLANDPLTEFREVNTDATLNLARKIAEAGVKRFVFISSIKVNGEDTNNGSKFSPDDVHVPTDPYGLSKYEAEQGLLALAKETGMEVVIIRPPLVYGPSVRANFLSMMKWINKGVPLPLGAVHNQRSLVALDNLVSFIIHCANHPKAANEIFLISDNEDVSTTELLNKVANAFGKKALLLPIPVSWMRFVANLIGKAGVADRLFGSLQVDSSKARELLNWKPVITMDEQMKKTAEAYLNEKTV